jgi:uncharacterized RDD family membrane protein YckC/DNA-binding transcriptional ArsR family regulator
MSKSTRPNDQKTGETVNSVGGIVSKGLVALAVDQESVSRILSVLSHPLRREILASLSEKGELSFTDLMNSLNVDTGKLSFHIRNLSGFIEQTPANKYILTRIGENAIRLIRDVETWAVEADLARRTSVLPVATLRKRVYAFLIDSAVVLSVFVVTGIMTGVFSSITGGGGFRLDVNVILFVIVFWVYSTLLEGFGGQSLGKRVIGLSVVRIDGKKLFYDDVGVRNIGKIFLFLPFDLLFGYRLKDKRFIRYFDKFAGTTVIDIRPQ